MKNTIYVTVGLMACLFLLAGSASVLRELPASSVVLVGLIGCALSILRAALEECRISAKQVSVVLGQNKATTSRQLAGEKSLPLGKLDLLFCEWPQLKAAVGRALLGEHGGYEAVARGELSELVESNRALAAEIRMARAGREVAA
jgi:hypothetical protein